MSRNKAAFNTKVSASLTIYMALMLPILLSLVLALFTGARIRAEKMKVEIVTDIAGNAVLGEYNRPLRQQYGLLMVDTAYDKGSPALSNMTERLDYYLSANTDGNTISQIGEFLLNTSNFSELSLADVSVPEYTFAGDNGSAVVQRQIFSYLEAEPLEGLLGSAEEATSGKADIEGQGAGGEDISFFENVVGVFEKISALFTDNSDQDLGGHTEDEVDLEDARQTQETMSDIAGQDAQTKKFSILDLVIPESETVSDASFDTGSVYTGRSNCLQGTGLSDNFDANVFENFGLFNIYLFEKFGYYKHPKENSHLQYQVEYLIGKKNTDKGNLAAVVWWLFAIRCVIDYVYAFRPDSKPGLVVTPITEALCLIPVIGVTLAELVKIFLTAVYAFIEGRNDVAMLMSGGKVPIIKTDDSWKTDLFSGLHGVTGSNSYGPDYKGYLLILMLLHEAIGSVDEETKRMMDIMELDIRKVPGYSNFRIDGCIDCYKVTVTYDGESGHSYEFTRFFGYEEAPR